MPPQSGLGVPRQCSVSERETTTPHPMAPLNKTHQLLSFPRALQRLSTPRPSSQPGRHHAEPARGYSLRCGGRCDRRCRHWRALGTDPQAQNGLEEARVGPGSVCLMGVSCPVLEASRSARLGFCLLRGRIFMYRTRPPHNPSGLFTFVPRAPLGRRCGEVGEQVSVCMDSGQGWSWPWPASLWGRGIHA